MSNPSLIKKYGNRRLYDTDESRYITLGELAAKVHGGADVRVVDAKTGEDLTQATLMQIVIERLGAAKMLPVPVLEQLIRLGDEALGEFLGHYLPLALEMYFQNRRNAAAMAAYSPFAALPFMSSEALARMFMTGPFGTSRAAQPPPPAWGSSVPQVPAAAEQPPAAGAGRTDEVAELRRELEEIKRTMLQRNEEPATPKRPPRPRSRKYK